MIDRCLEYLYALGLSYINYSRLKENDLTTRGSNRLHMNVIYKLRVMNYS